MAKFIGVVEVKEWPTDDAHDDVLAQLRAHGPHFIWMPHDDALPPLFVMAGPHLELSQQRWEHLKIHFQFG